MKTTKLMMGAVAAVLMATGCGSSSPCEQLDDTITSSVKRLSACSPSDPQPTQAELDALFDQKTCETASKSACSDKEAETVADAFDCVFDKITCSTLDNMDDAALEAQFASCEAQFKDVTVTEACLNAMFPVDDSTAGGRAVVTKTMRRALSR